MNVKLFGVGIDLVSVERISRILARFPKFIETVLSAKEFEELTLRQSRFNAATLADKFLEAQAKQVAIFVAKRWAAKEAIFKAIGGRFELSMSALSVLNNQLGMPFLDMLSLEAELRKSLMESSYEELLFKVKRLDLDSANLNKFDNLDIQMLQEYIVSQLSNFTFHLSISDEKQNVIAICIAQRLDL